MRLASWGVLRNLSRRLMTLCILLGSSSDLLGNWTSFVPVGHSVI